jgi:starch phosphorylase
MNEGHSAFMGLERTRLLMTEQGVSFREAIEIVRAGTVFTTHTPVEAGIDHFAPDLLEKYIGKYYRALGLSRDEFLGLGRQNPLNSHESFCMAVLALKLAAHSNGVSELHGDVSRQMWKNLWPELPEEHLPLSSITNGVHPKTWLSQDMSGLLTRYLGSRWQEEPTNQAVWRRVSRIPDAEIWRIHERCRERLVGFARERLKAQLAQVGATPKEIESAEEVLDPETLTIGFARRFATYKRGTLLLRDPERLARILNNPGRPVQIIFAGKAHPHDNEGKELIRQIVQFSKGEAFRNRIVFIDDYDMSVARHLVQGVDVWLNTPRRPLEASGTSGMKVAFNGGLNMSVLDGWWCEGYRGNNGWAIGKGEVYSDLEFQNEVEGRAIYDLLEKEVVPLFYDRGSDSIPRSWISWMKNSMMSLCPFFSTDRMVQEYTDRFYIHAYDHRKQLADDNLRLARDLSQWKQHIHTQWQKVRIEAVECDGSDEVASGSRLSASTRIFLGDVSLADVAVDAYFGVLDSRGNIVGGELVPFSHAEELGNGMHRFQGVLECRFSGRHGFLIRIMPQHPELGPIYEPGFLRWG